MVDNSKKTVFSQLSTKSALLDAWRVVQKKRKAGGIDKVSVEYYEKNFNQNIDSLLKKLKSNQYVPEPYERVHVKKDNKPGEFRPLSLPTIDDKILQQALVQILHPIFNHIFLDISYAYRPGKGPAKAISRISHVVVSEKIKWAACADIDRFFDKMDHDILIKEMKKKVDEPEVTKLIMMWLKIGVVNPKGSYEETPYGIAQGGVISPILSNIYLHPFDAYMVERGCHYIRYADNFILMAKNRQKIEEDFSASQYFLKEVLKLSLNKQKRYFNSINRGFVFMGIFFKGNSKFIDRSRIQRIKDRLKSLVFRKLQKYPKQFCKKIEEKEGLVIYYPLCLKCRSKVVNDGINIDRNFNKALLSV